MDEIEEFQSSAEYASLSENLEEIAEVGGSSKQGVVAKLAEGGTKREENGPQLGDSTKVNEDEIDEFESCPESESPLLKKNPSIEVLDDDEFELLDGASELAVLTSGEYLAGFHTGFFVGGDN